MRKNNFLLDIKAIYREEYEIRDIMQTNAINKDSLLSSML